jgi:NADH:ubiquinone oxidoreductase subunit 6 (subunit J)
MDLFIIILLSLIITFSFFAIEVEKRIIAIVFLGFASFFVGLVFIYVGALYAGIFHLLVYSGVLTVLFAAASNFVESKPNNAKISTIEVDLFE